MIFCYSPVTWWFCTEMAYHVHVSTWGKVKGFLLQKGREKKKFGGRGGTDTGLAGKNDSSSTLLHCLANVMQGNPFQVPEMSMSRCSFTCMALHSAKGKSRVIFLQVIVSAKSTTSPSSSGPTLTRSVASGSTTSYNIIKGRGSRAVDIGVSCLCCPGVRCSSCPSVQCHHGTWTKRHKGLVRHAEAWI